MNRFDELRKQTFSANKELNKGTEKMVKVDAQTKKLINITGNIDEIMDSMEKEFLMQTKLERKDLSFLFFSVALQCIRQYLITPFQERLAHDKVAESTLGKTEEHSDRMHSWYNPSLTQILDNPVPYDAIMGSKDFGLNIGGGFNHRAKTLGHDAILGWIFGTMNIATSTVTLNDFSSFHVKTRTTANGSMRDAIAYNAQLNKIIDSCVDKMLYQGRTGKEKMAISLVKEGVHLASDLPSKASLPIPIVSTFDINLAKDLADYGLDMQNVVHTGKQAVYAELINLVIAMLHKISYREAADGKLELYKYKTSKIITYSNAIASTSNLLFVALSTYMTGDTGNLKYLDIGGFLVTLRKVVNNKKIRIALEEEFLTSGLSNLISEI